MAHIARLDEIDPQIEGRFQTQRGSGLLEFVIDWTGYDYLPSRDKTGSATMPILSNRNNRDMSSTVSSALALGFTHARLRNIKVCVPQPAHIPVG